MVGLSSKGLDSVTTELCVTAPMDAAGFARPRVLLDVTDALRSLGVMVFKADIHSARSPGRPLLEVHRFLLTDLAGQPIVDPGEFRAASVSAPPLRSPTIVRAAHKARAARARQPAGLRSRHSLQSLCYRDALRSRPALCVTAASTDRVRTCCVGLQGEGTYYVS